MPFVQQYREIENVTLIQLDLSLCTLQACCWRATKLKDLSKIIRKFDWVWRILEECTVWGLKKESKESRPFYQVWVVKGF